MKKTALPEYRKRGFLMKTEDLRLKNEELMKEDNRREDTCQAPLEDARGAVERKRD